MYSISIIVYRNRAFLPVQAKFESGMWTDIEPVYEAELNVDEIVLAIDKVIEAGQPSLPEPTAEEWKKRKDPVLAASGARSWKMLARNGAAYSISQLKEDIVVAMTYTDKKGRWQFDPEKRKTFPVETLMREIVEVILEDVQTRPEVLMD